MNNPLFSIIVPVYNAKNYLVRCLDSIKNQTYGDFEALVIDDGSTDGSDVLCDSYCATDSRFKVFHQSNSGVSSARNMGLKLALGKYVTFADSDDTLLPDTLMLYKNIYHTDNHIDIIRGGYFRTIEDHNVEKIHTESDRIFSDKSDLFKYLEENQYYSFVWNMCVRRDTIGNLRFNEKINWLEDHLFSYQCYMKCQKVYVCCKPIYNYTIREKSEASLSALQNPEIVSTAMDLEYEWKVKLNDGKYESQQEDFKKTYRRNIHRTVCLTYYGDYPYQTRKKLSQKKLKVSDELFREDALFYLSPLPFFVRNFLIKTLLKLKGRFAPYE